MERYYQKEIECASQEQIKAWQDERLVRQVRHVWDKVPYYRAKMEEKGVTPEDIHGRDDLYKLPFLSKADLRDAYPFGLLAEPLEKCVRIHSTSGTTGKRVVAFYTKEDIDLWNDCCARALAAAGAGPEDVCQVAYGYGLFTGGFGSIFLPAITALISGCVYMLLAARLGKFGGITVMGVIIGLFLFISGHFVLSFIASIVFPVAADLIARAGKYKSKALLLVSYVVFSYGLTGPILPLWFMKDAYVASLQARGKDAAYIDGVFVNINTGTFFISMIAILVCAVLGGWFGQRMMKKHFIKAGIA